MSHAVRLSIALALAFLVLMPARAMADRRIALLIGNSSYEAVTRLVNPPKDVATMKAALDAAGFDEVDTALDLGHDALIRTLRSFEDQASDADIAVVYYSGHGMEMNGQNYLVPIDAKLRSDRDVEDETVSLERVMRTVDGARRLKLVILDACRNNPFLAKMSMSKGSRAIDRGLARVEPASSDSLIAFAAKAGTTASDGDSANSPFAAALAQRIIAPGVDVQLALRQVRDDVMKLTHGEQEPFFYGSLGGDILPLSKAAVETASAAPVPSSTTPANGCADAAAHWAEAQKFDRLEFYQRHLQLFGNCAFADFARAKIEEKQRDAAVTQPESKEGGKLAALTPAFNPTVPAGAPPVNDCDRRAAIILDPDAVAPGVDLGAADKAAAEAACRQAVADSPNTRRFVFQLGRVLDVQRRFEEAATLYRTAAGLGSSAAMRNLGMLYEDGTGVPKDFAEAARLYQQASDLGYVVAANNLGVLYEGGRGVPKNVNEAFRLYKLAADKGYSVAQHNLAWMYDHGEGTARDSVEAVRLYKLAADQGYADAINNLGTMYRDGTGVQKDVGEAFRLFKVAFDKGNVWGARNLGNLYEHGTGVQQDWGQAVYYYKIAADHGNASAAVALGYAYVTGNGVTKDFEQSYKYYKFAADAGDSDGLYNVCILYVNGTGVPRDDNEAARLCAKSADLGNSDGMYELGWLYANGRGVQKNNGLAAQWILKSVSSGNAFGLKQMTSNYQAWTVPFRRAVQQELRDRGIYSGPVDGRFSEATISAIRGLTGG